MLLLQQFFNVTYTVTFHISFALYIVCMLAIGYIECFSKFFSCLYVFSSQLLAHKQSPHQKAQHRSTHVYTCHEIL